MAQVKIYGIDEHLAPIKYHLSEVIHECVMEALSFPRDKRAHRVFPMARENWLPPAGRSDAYTIIEITMMSGRTVETRKKLIRLLFDRIEAKVGIAQQDIEICLTESPPCNWGFRGIHGDEAQLNYSINV